jgi:integrase
MAGSPDQTADRRDVTPSVAGAAQRVRLERAWALCPTASSLRLGDNPIDGVPKRLPKQIDKDDHHAAMPYDKIPDFVKCLQACDSNEIVRVALEFLILTATRTNEVLRAAKWSEIDIDDKLWTVPSDRMKAGRAHRVPDRSGAGTFRTI